MDREYNNDILMGKNPILEALKARRPINKILIQRGEHEGTVRLIEAKAREQGIPVQFADKAKLDGLTGGGSHQGVLALASLKRYSDVDEILRYANEKNEPELIIVLDEIEDPHNLGAIIRTAETAGAHGIIIPKRHSAGLTPVVGKSSAGAVEFINIARVPNITEVLKNLKSHGLWVIGADAKAETSYLECDMKDRIAIVIGGEAMGLGRLVRETCDFVVSIPTRGKISSLNASVAAGIMMFEALRQRGW
jgi:23S rRNA (guanosine2251-2'-O)-methyltransferase